jgi:hypothetical protein
MLFDLRGRGRRRTVQAIYLSLAVLMGGGLVLFGIGGNTSGGLLDALNGSSGGTSSNFYKKQVAQLERRLRVNPQDRAALLSLARVNFQAASVSGEDYDQNTGAYTDKGRAILARADSAWQRYLATNPSKPDGNVANLMVTAYDNAGLNMPDKAVDAIQLVIDQQGDKAALYSRLAILAYEANQIRKSTLAQVKAESLAPKSQRKLVQAQITQAKQQIDSQRLGQATGQGKTNPVPSPSG